MREIKAEKYPILRGEMVKKGLVNRDLANLLKVHSTTIGNKFNNRGNCDFTISEAISIKNTYFPNIGVEELFQKKPLPECESRSD